MSDFRSLFGRKAAGATAATAAPSPAADFRTRFTRDLDKMDQLPSLPAVVARLMSMLKDPKVSTHDLARALREDPPLTARVLRMANSPVYGNGSRVLSVPDAMMRLGTLEVQNLIMSVGLLRSLQRSSQSLDYRTFWSHWFTVATAAEALAGLATATASDQDGGAFTAGLLHDIGRFVLAQFYAQAGEMARREMTQKRLSLVTAERRVLGMDHAEIGGLLATRWGLPKPIVAGIAHHHHPEGAEPSLRRLPVFIYLGERLCEEADLGDTCESESMSELAPYWSQIGVEPEQAVTVVNAATASAAKSAMLLAVA